MISTNSINSHLKIKNERYHMVIGYKDANGEWKQKWKSTGLPVRGNKKRAEKMLRDYTEQIRKSLNNSIVLHSDNTSTSPTLVTFADYLLIWLEQHKANIRASTYLSYSAIIKGQIVPYFQERGTLLVDLNQVDISDYYNSLYEKGILPNSVKKYHANIRKALDFAYKREMIPSNPADKVQLRKANHYVAEYYSIDELNLLFENLKQDKHWLEDIVLVTSFYGLRRSEVLGLKWDCIDFEKNVISIEHTVTTGLDEDGKNYLELSDSTKTTASKRELPLVDMIKKLLLLKREQQTLYRRICGNSYQREYLGYIFVDELGEIINPNRITHSFRRYLESKKLKRIRFHDLRHSCASLMLNNGIELKKIQQWLGHTDISTTANIYAHLNKESQVAQAEQFEHLLFTQS